MKAIVLSFDKHAPFCELLYKAYMKNWPNCPLLFRIPWNNKEPSFFSDKENVELIKCKKPIRATMKALLKDIPDDEWVYWCIDDRYPIEFLNIESLNKLHDKLNGGSKIDYNAIKVLRWREARDISRPPIKLSGRKYFLQEPSSAPWGFYHHQFCRASLLKWVFLDNGLSPNYSVPSSKADSDGYLVALQKWLKKTPIPKILIPEKGLIHFGETINDRKIMKSCIQDLKKYNCEIPKMPIANYSKVFRHNGKNPKKEIKK